MAGYKRHSPPVPDLSPFLNSPVDGPVDDDCHMPEPQRPPLEQRPLPVNESLQPRSKRQKLSHPSGSQPPRAFWDNLSQLWLTKRALRELDRRNAAPNLSYGRPPGPITRRARDEPTQSVADFLCQCGPACLTDIEQFARHGGPDLSDLRGYPEPTALNRHMMSSNRSSAQSRKRKQQVTSASDQPITNTTKSTGPYDRAFQQNLIDGGVFPFAYEYPDGRVPAEPKNQEEIKQRLAQPRSSLSPSKFSEEAHKKFVRADAHASKERQVTTSVIPLIEGEVKDPKCVSGGIPFTNLDHLTDGTLVPGNPDLYYGARPEQLNRRVRDELSGQIIPSKQHDLPITPNFFLAAKGPDGSSAVAGRQACYDGALGARGVHSLQSYGEDKPVYDNKAYTITSIYLGGTLKLYTSHPTQPTNPRGRPEYCMTQLKAYAMTSDPETFRKGASAYRNARDWTKEQRDEAIRRANERADDRQVGELAFNASFDEFSGFSSDASPHETHNTEALDHESQTSLNKDSNTTADPPEPETSADELSLDHNIPAKRLRRHSKRSHQPQQN